MSDVSLLPRNASPFERALEQGMAQRIEQLDAEAPARFHRPATLPEAHLPFLAWEVDVPLWLNFSEAERRALIAQSPDLHRLAGTLTGARRLASWAGGTVVRAVTRRNRAFAGATLSAAEREAWLQRLPELRIYTFRQRGQAHATAHLLGRVHPARRFAVPSTARARFAERATWVRNSIETDLTVWTLESNAQQTRATTTRRVAAPGTAREGWRFAGRVLRTSSAASRLYTLSETSNIQSEAWSLSARMLPVPDNLNPVTVGMDDVAQPGIGNAQRYSCSILRGQQLTPSTARDRLYRRARLADSSIPPAARGRGAYMTRGRLSPPAWRAELKTEIRGTARGAWRYLSGALPRHDAQRLDTVKSAIEWGRPAAAEWRIDTHTRAQARAGIQYTAGPLRAGQTVNVR